MLTIFFFRATTYVFYLFINFLPKELQNIFEIVKIVDQKNLIELEYIYYTILYLYT